MTSMRTFRGWRGAITQLRDRRREGGDHIYLMQQITAVLVSATVVLVYNTLPVLSTVLQRDLKFDGAAVTAFSAAEMTGVGVGSAASVAIMRWLSPRLTLRISLVGLMLSNLASAILPSEAIVIGARVPGGFCAAVAIGAAYYIYGLRQFERNTGLNLIGTSLVTFTALAPFSMFKLSASMVFWGYGLILIPSLLLSRWFPTDYVDAKAKAATAGDSGEQSPKRMVRTALGLAAAVSGTMAIGMFWAFLAPIAAGNHIPEQAVATALSVGTGASFVSAMLVTAIGAKLRTGLILATGTVLNVICLLAVGHAGWPSLFIAGLAGWYICIPLLGAISLGFSMQYAPHVRYAVHISAIRHVALPAAPLLAALLAQFGGHDAVTLAIAVAAAGASLLLWVYVLVSRSFIQPAAIERTTE